jgi:hypothetical protein
MPRALPPPPIALAYEEAAQAYLRSLPLEHFMEATAPPNMNSACRRLSRS